MFGGDVDPRLTLIAGATAPVLRPQNPRSTGTSFGTFAGPRDEATGHRFALVEPVVTRADDFGIERFVIVYSSEELLSRVRIAIEVQSGDVRTTKFP